MLSWSHRRRISSTLSFVASIPIVIPNTVHIYIMQFSSFSTFLFLAWQIQQQALPYLSDELTFYLGSLRTLNLCYVNYLSHRKWNKNRAQ